MRRAADAWGAPRRRSSARAERIFDFFADQGYCAANERDRMRDRESGSAGDFERKWSIRLVGAVLLSPLAAACAWLSDGRWGALLDLALFEARVRDVGTRYAP